MAPIAQVTPTPRRPRLALPHINTKPWKGWRLRNLRLRRPASARVNQSAGGVREEMALDKAKEIVSSNSVVVFSKTFCPFCTRAKQLLTQLGAKFKVIELDEENDGSKIQSALAQWTAQRTVPNVFIGGSHIGGSDTLAELHEAGKLVPLLTEAGALVSSAA